MDTLLFNRILNWIVILLCLVLIICLVMLPFDDCSKCKYKENNKELSVNQFMRLYDEKCLSGELITSNSLNLSNLSLYNA